MDATKNRIRADPEHDDTDEPERDDMVPAVNNILRGKAVSTRLVTSVSERWYFSAFSSAVLFTWAFFASAPMESVSSTPFSETSWRNISTRCS